LFALELESASTILKAGLFTSLATASSSLQSNPLSASITSFTLSAIINESFYHNNNNNFFVFCRNPLPSNSNQLFAQKVPPLLLQVAHKIRRSAQNDKRACHRRIIATLLVASTTTTERERNKIPSSLRRINPALLFIL
jgi:hypothetical protein